MPDGIGSCYRVSPRRKAPTVTGAPSGASGFVHRRKRVIQHGGGQIVGCPTPGALNPRDDFHYCRTRTRSLRVRRLICREGCLA